MSEMLLQVQFPVQLLMSKKKYFLMGHFPYINHLYSAVKNNSYRKWKCIAIKLVMCNLILIVLVPLYNKQDIVEPHL